MTPDARTELVGLCIGAQVDNTLQERKLYDPSPAIDSIIEHGCWLLKHAPSEAHRRHAAAIVALAADTQASNRHEREQVQAVAGRIDRPAAGAWSLRAVIRETRDHLAALLNPITGAEARDRSYEAILAVIRDAPAELVGSHARPNLTLRHELGAKKTTLLWDLRDAAQVTA